MRLRRQAFGVLVLAVALVVVSCGRDGGKSAGPGSENSDSSTLPDTARVAGDGDRAFVLAGDSLYRSEQGRLVLVSRTLPGAGSARRAVGFDGSRGVLATDSGDVVTVFDSSDAGQAWGRTTQKSVGELLPEGVGGLDVARSSAVIVVLVRAVTGSNFVSGALLTSKDDGTNWSLRQAPSAGEISAAGGVFFLVGGVAGDQVYASSDGIKWDSVSLGVEAQSWSAAPPTYVPSVGELMPVTIHDAGETSKVILLRSNDKGRTWTSITSVETAGHTESGTVIPVSITPEGDWFILQSDGARIYTGSITRPDASKTLSPNGLPSGIEEAAFLSSNEGMALVQASSCPSGKDSCALSKKPYHTSDAGQTWELMSVG